jgi:hypothetical protein
MADVVSAALRTSVEMWATEATDVSLPDLVRECDMQMRAGLPYSRVARRFHAPSIGQSRGPVLDSSGERGHAAYR